MPINCPECGAQFDLSQAMEDADGRRFVGLLADLPPVVVKPLLRYLKLFKPAKQGLRWSRMYTLTKELLPMIQQAEVTRNGLHYICTVEQWAAHMTDLAECPPESLRRPLTGNGYLISIAANQADQTAAKAEKALEAQARYRSSGTTGGLVAAANVVACEPPKKKRPPEGWKDEALGRKS
jgi:hypothetical protein